MSSKKKSKTKKRIAIGIISVLVLAVVLGFFMKPKLVAYDSAVAKTGDITTYLSFSGNVETKNRQTVVADKVMQISDLKVKEGDTVKEGDVLFTTSMNEDVKSDINGEIVNLSVEKDAQVMAGTKLMDIVDYNNLEISVKVDEYDIAAVTKGKATTVTIGALNKNIKGTVSSMSKEGQVLNGITYFIATIDLAKDSSLKIGMSAEVKLVSAKVTNVVTLPIKYVQFNDDNTPYVLKQGAKMNQTVKVTITTGINDGTTVEVKSGVSKGETILLAQTTSTASGMFPGRNTQNSNSGGGN